MKRAIRLVPERGEYEDCRVPDGASAYEYDFSTVVACAGCGEPLTYAESFTSRLVRNDLGFGYAVCPRCYAAEWGRMRRSDEV